MQFADKLEHRHACYAARDVAAAELAEARKVLAEKEHADAGAEAARVASDLALHEHLKELGVHYLLARDGTLTTYHAIDAPPGWMAQHPVPGALPEGVSEVVALAEDHEVESME